MSDPMPSGFGVRFGVPERTPTNERTNGRTNEESLSPTRDNPVCFVTRAPAYEIVVCPICSHDVTKGPTGKRRVYCSPLCHNRGNARLIRSRAAEVDEMAVVRLVAGDFVLSTRGSRIEAVRILTARGRSASWIAEQLHTTRRSVERYRAEITTRKAA